MLGYDYKFIQNFQSEDNKTISVKNKTQLKNNFLTKTKK